jgi:hypothetical protein
MGTFIIRREAGFRIQDSGFRSQDSGFRIQKSGFRIQDSEVRIQDSEAGPLRETPNPDTLESTVSGFFS